ncbi:MAG: outer membrane lipid asymmetry maintenance protein MlaD [Deltaproteobacteria bacterium CG23_combo_of_CG06-09_8_20_14_all_60_8]|nr:MAG: outer membrane lipid asymmetry maintenance protein MlaD [Deltaproteobacteria bacterium CG23_combo_of_CG06-09_8_20_14_all_60_8]
MKKIGLEFIVGLFMIVGFLAFVYVSLQFGEFSVFAMKKNYSVFADFDSVSGLKTGAVIEVAGVPVGKVAAIGLGESSRARVTLQIGRDVTITEDAIASIKTQGIIGDKYMKIQQGGSADMLRPGGVLSETESAVDLEELVSKYIFGKI